MVGGVLQVAPTRLVDEATRSVLYVGGGRFRDKGAHEAVRRGFVGLQIVHVSFQEFLKCYRIIPKGSVIYAMVLFHVRMI